jgi:hypothetical protein
MRLRPGKDREAAHGTEASFQVMAARLEHRGGRAERMKSVDLSQLHAEVVTQFLTRKSTRHSSENRAGL